MSPEIIEILKGLFVLLNIVLMESILSIDNAAVIATIVNKNLDDPKDRIKALRYGMIGAYVFRGLSLLLVSYILNYPSYGNIFMVLGGFYLMYLFADHLKPKQEEEQGETAIERFFGKLGINVFIMTIIVVEIVDLVFSLDNLVAVVGMSTNMWIVVAGVFIGIAVMRFVATKFTVLLAKYPKLEGAAFIIIGLIGLKLVFTGIVGLATSNEYGIGYANQTGTINFFLYSREILGHHSTDLIFSAFTMLIFIIPFIFGKKSVNLVSNTDAISPECAKVYDGLSTTGNFAISTEQTDNGKKFQFSDYYKQLGFEDVSDEEWRSLSREQKEAFLQKVNAAAYVAQSKIVTNVTTQVPENITDNLISGEVIELKPKKRRNRPKKKKTEAIVEPVIPVVKDKKVAEKKFYGKRKVEKPQ